MLQLSTAKILQSYEEFCRNGSGWILETIDFLRLYTAEFAPMHGNSYIPTPEAIVDKLGITVLQIPVRASRHGPLADFFQQTGPVLVREAV